MVPKASSKLGALHSGLSCCSSLQVITLRITHPRDANTENLPPNLDYPESVSSLTPTGFSTCSEGRAWQCQAEGGRGAGREGCAEHGWGTLGTELWHWGQRMLRGCCSHLGTGGTFDQECSEAATAASADLL